MFFLFFFVLLSYKKFWTGLSEKMYSPVVSSFTHLQLCTFVFPSALGYILAWPMGVLMNFNAESNFTGLELSKTHSKSASGLAKKKRSFLNVLQIDKP